MRIVIIGAGPCGLAAGHRLNELGFHDFTVFERADHAGGLATSFRDAKGFTWDTAIHVAHSHYTYFDKLMDDLLPGGFQSHIRKSWVREYGAFIPYPYQYNIRHLPPGPRQECIDGLLALARAPQKTPANFLEWILASAGAGIAKHFMIPYNRKVWTVDPAEMNRSWIGDRVPAVDVARVLQNIKDGRDDVAWGPNATFQFPKSGGTGSIWNALAARLKPGQLRLSTGVMGVDAANQTITLSDGTTEPYDALVSTIPITTLTRLTGLPALADRAAGLRHSRVYTVGLGPSIPMPESLTDKTWLYCPEDACRFYRVTPFSTFSADLVPDPSRQCSLLCEFAVPGGQAARESDLVGQAVDGLAAIGLMDIDRASTHAFVMDLGHGYPIPTLDRDDILADVLPALEKHAIFSRGRFGGWKYEVSNMDHAVMQGVEVAERILNGTPETTLFRPDIVNAGKR